MNPKLSIITICYNDLSGLKETIPSVLSQSVRDFEWIIVDGASTDGSIEYINETTSNQMSQDTQMKILWKSEPDNGIYNAMNKGVRMATGDYCLFLNAGDVFCSKRSLERAFKRCWHGEVISCDEFVMSNKKFWDYIQAPRKLTFHRILTGYLPHQTTFIKRTLLNEFPYREEYRIVADWAFWWEALVASDHRYQHFDFPLAVFDCTGVSSTNYDKNYAEREKFLSNYINNKHLLTKISNECLMSGTIEGDYLFNSERSVLKRICLFIRRVYVHIYQPLHKVYANIRWR